ncbi:MAG TPA: alpha/beta hydrolase [Flavisolibacter sp.]|nr:alpha/beta hydrolase [Flavisolibacter sp.]
MRKIKRLIKSFFRLVLPVLLLVVLAAASASTWLVHETAQPKVAAYLVTPEKYGQLSARAAQITDETWTNHDGTIARGWLLRGAEGAPAVILLHKYGADRSYCLNLGVKLSEATNFTVLMPDERGHGENPPVKYTSFGGREADDTLAAIDFLRTVKTTDQIPLVGKMFGVYGVEMGAVAALIATTQNPEIKVLVLDSVPQGSDGVLSEAVSKRFPFASVVTSKFAKYGANIYFYDGSYKQEALCTEAKTISNRKVLLLAGRDAPNFQESTSKLSKCLQVGSDTEAKTDLSPSGYSITDASLEQAEAYDQRVIDFFRAGFGG